jgi:hypothetical protein
MGWTYTELAAEPEYRFDEIVEWLTVEQRASDQK